MYSDTL